MIKLIQIRTKLIRLELLEHMACLLFHWTKLVQAWLARVWDTGTWSLYKGLLSGPWEWLLPVCCSLINWWSCKILQITSSSQKLLLGLVQHYPIRLLSPIWVSLAECTDCYCCGQFLWFLSMMAPCAPDHQDSMSPMFVWPRPSTLRPGLTSLLTSERGLIMARPGRTGPGTRWAASPGVRMLKSCTNTQEALHKARIFSSLLRVSNQNASHKYSKTSNSTAHRPG